MTSRFKDDMEEILNEMSDLVDDWEKHSNELAEEETTFKAWQAGQKKALIDAGDSAAKAEVSVQAEPEWSIRYLKVQKMQIQDQVWKRKMAIADKAFDAERSREATLRNIR
tara:strand:- start:104 stop:436 length:333 start_codon:yes stop_codon:yes gene_type:complete